jgi:uncharacterized protein YecT (DUF1311 family)
VGRRGRVLMGAALAAVCGLTAACGSGSPESSGGSSPGAAPPFASGPAAAGSTAMPSVAAAAQFSYIVEPFDQGHPARYRTAPARCGGQSSTTAIEQCYETRTENADAAIDAVQLSRFELAPKSARAAIAADDSAWLSARQPVCAAAFHSGGTIDGINVAACLLDESTARLAAVQGKTRPVDKLTSTDSPDIRDVAWYTTPEGSRIGMQASQGGQSGGAIVAWTIIGGASGFVVSPRQFPFQDGSFTRQGTTRTPDPAGHRVTTGTRFTFSLDYKHLSADPNATRGGQTYDYAPGGAPVAVWG